MYRFPRVSQSLDSGVRVCTPQGTGFVLKSNETHVYVDLDSATGKPKHRVLDRSECYVIDRSGVDA